MLLPGLGSVRKGKNCDLGLENVARGRKAFSRPRSQFFPIRTSLPANDIFIFRFPTNLDKIILIVLLRQTVFLCHTTKENKIRTFSFVFFIYPRQEIGNSEFFFILAFFHDFAQQNANYQFPSLSFVFIIKTLKTKDLIFNFRFSFSCFCSAFVFYLN